MVAWRSLKSLGLTSPRFGTVREVIRAVRDDALYDAAAGLAYYALLALVPFLVLCILLVSLVLDEHSSAAAERIVALVGPRRLLPETIQETIHSVASSARAGFLVVA